MRKLTSEQENEAQQLARNILRLQNPADRARWLLLAPAEIKPRIQEIIKTEEGAK